MPHARLARLSFLVVPVALGIVVAGRLSTSRSAFAAGAITAQPVAYEQGGTKCEGLLAYDPAVKGKRPGVLVVHDWMGVGPFVKGQVEKLAELGYVAFAADIYGKDVRPTDAKQASEQASKYKADRALLRARALAALDVLKKQPDVDPAHVAVIGYCFGGTTALEVGRAGADVVGVVSFHGGLGTPTPEDAKNLKGKVLALHGADDPYVKADEVAAFEDEMRKAHADWQLVKYGNAVHSFTIPGAGSDSSKGAAYNAVADVRSWKAMRTFFDEVFGAASK